MAIFLYAEHLLNIRAISVQAVLPCPSNKNTRATLSTAGTHVTLSHEGDTATIQLPTHVRGDQIAAALPIPTAPSDTLSFRVQLQESSVANASQEVENILPWNAHSLATSTQLSCTHCQEILLHRGTVLVWKNLPSENWAEMMDFWHCHRPDPPHDGDHVYPAVAKGYSADSALAINPGVGMVDPVDFVLANEDCCNLKVTASHKPQGSEEGQLECVSCGTTLGHVHTSGSYKLRKLHLAVSSSASQASTSHDAEKWWSCLLLSSIDCQGVRKFTIQDSQNSTQSIRLWVFTPDMTVSSSATDASKPMRAVKIFWQDCDSLSRDTGALNRQMLGEGELELPLGELRELRAKLAISAELLPIGARKFQDWNVALLPRFTSDDL